MIALALIVLPMVLLLSSLQVWLHRSATAGMVAREAARLVAVAPDRASGLTAVDDLEAGYEARLLAGRQCPDESGCIEIAVSDRPDPPASVEVRVNVWMPGFSVPFLAGSEGFWASTTHVEVLDPYRARG